MDRRDSCVLCNAPAGQAVPGVGGYRVCTVCDIAWRCVEDSPDPGEDWERHYYGDDRLRELHERRISGLLSLARRITQVLPSRGRLLDVGAGLGIFMEAMAKSGWSVEGVEPSDLAAREARRRTSSPVHLGLLEDVELPESSYDAITSFDVLRTLPDPMIFLRRARRLLRPGGTLVIRELHRKVELSREKIRDLRGHRASPGRKAFEFRQCFSPKSLLFAFDQIGLIGSWVEPSPVFEEPDGSDTPAGSLLKRSLGWASSSAYRLSGHRIVLGPNLLAFGRAPSI